MNRANKGLLSQLYPTTKFVFLLSAIFLGAIYDWKFGYFIILPLTMVLALFEGKFFPFFKKVVAALIVFVVFIFLFKVMLDNSDSTILFQWQFITIKTQGLIDGFNQTSILVIIAATVILFFETTDVEDFMISLQQMNVSHLVSYVFLATLQMIPDMVKRSKVIMQAQQARGIETEGNIFLRLKAFFPSLGPLIISSIADLEDRAITLEVRGFSANVPKTHLKQLEMKTSDKWLMGLIVLLTLVLVGWRIQLWLF